MNLIKVIGLIVLAAVWIWLCCMIVAGAGFTLRTLFTIVASGIIIFVPLWKKYIAPDLNRKKK
ncbi:MAG: hypothetical protein U0L83_07220 [Muribaculaceae bacterium]|nr:hypothetical protein [Muribaculaceae bacterium]